jgi:hypothetical protein
MVYIAGLEEGLLPHERSAQSPDDLEENGDYSSLVLPGQRQPDGHLRPARVLRGQFIRSTPSQFLYEVGFGGEKASFAEMLTA